MTMGRGGSGFSHLPPACHESKVLGMNLNRETLKKSLRQWAITGNL